MRDMRNIRLDEMESMVIKRGVMTLKQLSDIFDISLNTVRSDIDSIVQRGRIKKVYGGVRSVVSESGLLDYRDRKSVV